MTPSTVHSLRPRKPPSYFWRIRIGSKPSGVAFAFVRKLRIGPDYWCTYLRSKGTSAALQRLTEKQFVFRTLCLIYVERKVYVGRNIFHLGAQILSIGK